jgi:hypothetical protein
VDQRHVSLTSLSSSLEAPLVAVTFPGLHTAVVDETSVLVVVVITEGVDNQMCLTLGERTSIGQTNNAGDSAVGDLIATGANLADHVETFCGADLARNPSGCHNDVLAWQGWVTEVLFV